MRGNTTKRTERRIKSCVTGVPMLTNRPSKWEMLASNPLHLRIKERNECRLDIMYAQRNFGDQLPFMWSVMKDQDSGLPIPVASGRAESLAQAKLMCLRRVKNEQWFPVTLRDANGELVRNREGYEYVERKGVLYERKLKGEAP